jgi:hypothetical protein
VLGSARSGDHILGAKKHKETGSYLSADVEDGFIKTGTCAL